jgi:aldose 1-epimerase
VLNKTAGNPLQKAAGVTGDLSGIRMEIWTEEPGIQFYGGNFMQAKNLMAGGFADSFRTAFCLEPQHFPDAPNRPAFLSTVLEPGQVYRSRSLYRFSVEQP